MENIWYKNEKIKYKVEIKKDDENEKFKESYIGDNNNCLIKNLVGSIKYKIRICSIYNNLEGEWSEIEEIQTSVDSIILRDSKKEKKFLNKIFEWSGYNNMELIYRGSRDGMTAKKFHDFCDNKGPTICLFKNEKENIFGGYSPISWESNDPEKWYKLDDSFMFTLTNIYDTEPSKFPHQKGKDSVIHYFKSGPGFDDLYSRDGFNNFAINFPRGHIDTLGKGKSIITGNSNNLKLIEVEIFKLIK